MTNKGKKVSVEYTGTFEDGTEFDSSKKHGKPLEFVAGEGQVVPGFDNAIVEMKVGEEKKITLEPKDAYGERRDDLSKSVPKDQVPQDITPQVGMQIGITLGDGRQFPAVISAVGESDITLDLNHPLAGKTLNFDLKLVDVSEQ
ncbi:MAG: FKBP-type peptidyl-prolyl cis-trans isomerase [Candidatus Woesearchaeota archaeon]